MNASQYLKLFFAEKIINYQQFEIECNGTVHFIDTDFVVDAILNTTSTEQEAIASVLRKLDFFNQPIVPFLRHLAQALVKKFEDGGQKTCANRTAA